MDFELKNYDMMRKAIEDFCAFLKKAKVSEDSIFNSRLVTSELVSNVFQHSNGTAFLSGDLSDEKICIKVRSTVFFRPPEVSTCSGVYAESGRGLFLVDTISEERSFSCDGEICVVLKAVYDK